MTSRRGWRPDKTTRLLLDGSPAGIVVRDLDGRYRYGNLRAQRDMGTAEPLEGRTLAELFSPELAEVMSRRDHEVASSGHPSISEGRFLLPAGVERSIVFATHPMRSPDGDTLIVAVVIERSDAVREPNESEIRFEQLIDSIEDVFVLSTVDPTTTLYVSPNASDVFDLGSKPLSTKHLLEIVHPDDRPAVVAALKSMGPDSREREFEYRVVHPRNGVRWLRSRSRPVKGPAGDSRMATVVNDITDERQLREDLAQALDEAKAANARKDEFLSHMSHEVRTPLHAILGFTQLLEWEDDDDRLTGEQLKCVHQIQRAGHHLLELINEVLDIQRIERGHLSLSIEEVDVERVVRDTIELLSVHARSRAVDLDLRAGETLSVAADRQRLIQVLINVVANGIKYNKATGHVQVSWEARADGSVRIEVTDDGHGIAPEEVDRVFAPFDRLGRDDTEGTGIGLTLSRQLIEAMGGTIDVASRLGEGTTFGIVLKAWSEPR